MPTPPPESAFKGQSYSDQESGSEVEGSGSDEEYESALNGYKSPSPASPDVKGKSRVSSPHTKSTNHQKSAKRASSWADLDLSIIVALVSPIGNWLTGGDHIKNLFLIILLIFYLHQIVEIPWQLYLSARPRKHQRRHASKRDGDERVAQLQALAQNELRQHEFIYLALAVASPFIGAAFLRQVLSALGDHNALSWFSTTLFVLATGIRPWTHLVNRLTERTQELQDAVHTPDEESLAHIQEETQRALDSALARIDSLEREVRDLREGVKRGEQLREVCDDLSEILGDLERTTKRNERKADTARSAIGARLSAVEAGLLQLEERRRNDIAAIEAAGFRFPRKAVLFEKARAHFWSLIDKLFNGTTTVHVTGILVNRIRSPEREKHHLAHLAPRLATIPEADDSDSEGTFVSDKGDGSASTKKGRSRSRSRSGSSGAARPRHLKAPSYSQLALEYAQSAVLWPYRFSVRVLVAVLPPVAKVVPTL
ncbi:hypothetical protein BV20DRAFT_1052042 [Pilatotrama ljubarskyi]|nr:hypothetical protein BV20DRAFT_1052042 [Pilatotrama ljubarskyi]